MSMSKYVDGWRWQILAVTGKEFEALPVRLVLRVFRVCDSLHRVFTYHIFTYLHRKCHISLLMLHL